MTCKSNTAWQLTHRAWLRRLRYGHVNEYDEYDALRVPMGLASEDPSNDKYKHDDEEKEEEVEKGAGRAPPPQFHRE